MGRIGKRGKKKERKKELPGGLEWSVWAGGAKIAS